MDLNFNKVDYDGDLEDAERDDLESLVAQYEEAQEANAAEFEAAKDTLDDVDDVDIEEFHDARSNLVDEITDYDAFADSPIDEDDLADASFGKLREYDAYFADQEATDDDNGDDTDFDDMGNESPVDNEGGSDAEFLEGTVGSIPGVVPEGN